MDEGLCASLGTCPLATRLANPARGPFRQLSLVIRFRRAPENLNFRAFDTKLFWQPHSLAVPRLKYASDGHDLPPEYIYSNVYTFTSARGEGEKLAPKGTGGRAFCVLDGFSEIRTTLLEEMAGTTRLELATSAVTGGNNKYLQ